MYVDPEEFIPPPVFLILNPFEKVSISVVPVFSALIKFGYSASEHIVI